MTSPVRRRFTVRPRPRPIDLREPLGRPFDIPHEHIEFSISHLAAYALQARDELGPEILASFVSHRQAGSEVSAICLQGGVPDDAKDPNDSGRSSRSRAG